MTRFFQDYIFCANEFIVLTSNLLNRKIQIYSVMDKTVRDKTIIPHEACGCNKETPEEPLYLLYYEDAHFLSPHYQSIRPMHGVNPQVRILINFYLSLNI